METYDFIAIDFETANRFRDSICQVGITTVKNGTVKDVNSWLVDPEVDFDGFNISIHHITPDMVKGKPKFNELWPVLLPYFTDGSNSNIVFAHNANFDIQALMATLKRYNLPIPECSFGCSLAVARRTWLGEPSYSLPILCLKFGIREGGHDAGEDSRACAELVLKAAQDKAVDFTKEMLFDGESELEKKFQIFMGSFGPEGYLSSICQRKEYRSRRERKVIIGDGSKNNPDSIFFQKNVLFTGTLSSMKRADAQQIIADIGGINQSGISKSTNFLIVGQQDYRVVGETGMSSKQVKAMKLVEQGFPIEILSEVEFLRSI